jgi:hypothetical protein
MIIKVCAVRRIFGKSNKTGNNYDMPQVVRLVDIEQRESNTYNLQGAGQVTIETPISSAFFPQLLDIFKNSIGDEVYMEMDLELGLDSNNNSIFVGFSAASQPKTSSSLFDKTKK